MSVYQVAEIINKIKCQKIRDTNIPDGFTTLTRTNELGQMISKEVLARGRGLSGKKSHEARNLACEQSVT